MTLTARQQKKWCVLVSTLADPAAKRGRCGIQKSFERARLPFPHLDCRSRPGSGSRSTDVIHARDSNPAQQDRRPSNKHRRALRSPNTGWYMWAVGPLDSTVSQVNNRAPETFGFVRDFAAAQAVCPRRVLPVTAEDSQFLEACAEQAHRTPDYSQAAIMAEGFYCWLEDAVLLGNTGAVCVRDVAIVESMLHLKKLARSPSYRAPQALRSRSAVGLFTSIFYLPEAESNIYHWLVDCLPRLWLVAQATDQEITLLCHATMTDYQRASLEPFLEMMPNVRLEEVARDEQVRMARYLFPSFLSGLNSGCVNPLALSYVRNGLMRYHRAPQARGPRRVYVRRSASGKRGLTNDEQVSVALEQLGFVSLEIERLNIWEQIGLLKDAELIVGVHGAGLTNMIFSHDARVIELHPAAIFRPHYLLLAKACGHRHVALGGGVGDAAERFQVDLAAILAAIEAPRESMP